MNKHIHWIPLLLLFCFVSLNMRAEEEDKKTDTQEETTEETPFFQLYSANVNLGWYWPKMDYWNDLAFPFAGVNDSFKGNFCFGGNVTVALPSDFRVRGGLSYWAEKVEGDPNAMGNSIKISFTRIRLGGLYAPEFAKFHEFQPYIGLEGQFYWIKNKLDNGEETLTQKGRDYALAPLIGCERIFGDIVLGMEFLYNIGKYTQNVDDGNEFHERKVSIAGPELVITVGYKF